MTGAAPFAVCERDAVVIPISKLRDQQPPAGTAR